MIRTMLCGLAAAAILTVTVGDAAPAEAAKKRNKATSPASVQKTLRAQSKGPSKGFPMMDDPLPISVRGGTGACKKNCITTGVKRGRAPASGGGKILQDTGTHEVGHW
jgi:hypothetical protein